MRRLLAEPLLHFAILGAALFGLYRVGHSTPMSSSEQIVVTAGHVDHLATAFARVWQRPPTLQELKGRSGQIGDGHAPRGWMEAQELTLSSSILSDPAGTQDAVEPTAGATVASHKDPDDWEFSLTPYLWMTSLRAEADVGPVSSTSEACFSELLEQMDMGAQMRFEGRRGHWGFYLDGTYMSLGSDARARIGPFRVRGLDVDGEFTQAWLEFGGMYRFGEPGRSFDVMVGGRYSYIAVDASVGPFLDVDESKDFWAPVVGGRWQYALSETWVLSLAGDVGGFGVGDAADLSWGVTGILGYRINDRTTLGIGYRFFDIDFSERALDLDLQFHGPIAGVTFRF